MYTHFKKICNSNKINYITYKFKAYFVLVGKLLLIGSDCARLIYEWTLDLSRVIELVLQFCYVSVKCINKLPTEKSNKGRCFILVAKIHSTETKLSFITLLGTKSLLHLVHNLVHFSL